MASGDSVRFGENKLVQNLNGKPLVSYILKTVTESRLFSDVAIVTRWSEVADIAGGFNCRVILHKEPLVSDTIRLGTQFFSKQRNAAPDALMFCVADQPLVTPETIHALIQKFTENPQSIVRLCKTESATGQKRFANPVIFPQCFFEELENLPPDETGRFVIKKHKDTVQTVEASGSCELLDADTKEEFEKIIEIQKSL